jgi:hypothetical protein
MFTEYGLGAVAIALIGLIWKIWHDHTILANKVTDAMVANAVVNEKLTTAVNENTIVTKGQTEAIKKQRDVFTKLATEALKLNNRHDDEVSPH